MNLQDLLQSIHNSEAHKLCKVSPAYRENERKIIAAQTEEFLKSGKKITVVPPTFSHDQKAA